MYTSLYGTNTLDLTVTDTDRWLQEPREGYDEDMHMDRWSKDAIGLR